jgi:MFS family permease
MATIRLIVMLEEGNWVSTPIHGTDRPSYDELMTATDLDRPAPDHPTEGARGAPRSSIVPLAVATGFAGVGLAAGGTGGALLVTDIAGHSSLAGVPFALVVAGSAVGAVLISWATVRVGRIPALVGGYAAGAVGAATALAGGLGSSVALVLAGSVLLGPANASVFLSRYAGADLGPEDERGRNLGVVMFALALGATLAPNLLGPADAAATGLGLARYSGLYLVAVLAFGAAGALLLRPGRAAPGQAAPPQRRSAVRPRPGPAPRRGPAALAGLVVLGAANMTMVGIMSVVPVHLTHHHHGLGAIGVVISVHVAAMFGPSPVVGRLSDRVGPARVAAAAGATLLVAGAWSAPTGGADLWSTTAALVLLGLGWNLAMVSGSAMLTAGVAPRHRPSAEAAGEVVMGGAAALGAAGAGLLAAGAGWTAMVLAGGAVGAAPVLAALAARPAASAPPEVVP